VDGIIEEPYEGVAVSNMPILQPRTQRKSYRLSTFLISLLLNGCASYQMPTDKELEGFLQNNKTRITELKSLTASIPHNFQIRGPDFEPVSFLEPPRKSEHTINLPDDLKTTFLRLKAVLKELRVESFSHYNNKMELTMSFSGANNWDCKKSITIGTPSDLQSTQLLDSLDPDHITLLLKKTDARVFSAYKQVNATTFLRIVCDH
jgi:hypothetical protein